MGNRYIKGKTVGETYFGEPRTEVREYTEIIDSTSEKLIAKVYDTQNTEKILKFLNNIV